ncbi:MAG: FAD-dependent oxidoreductase [Bacteroidota bacterium]
MTVDALVIGGGIFGCHAAIYLAKQGKRVVLVEQDDQLIKRASIVNQARLHAGYHYPRSIATAKTSDTYIERFRRDFADCINDSYVHYYAIARRGSLTDAAQFQHFCDYLQLPCERVEHHPAFNYDQLEAVFAAKEDSFDPLLLAERYRAEVADYANIHVQLNTRVGAVKLCAGASVSSHPSQDVGHQTGQKQGREAKHDQSSMNDYYQVELRDTHDRSLFTVETPLVVNATYASINTVNRQFGVGETPLLHEIAEMAFVKPVAAFENAALTVMDGPFCSLMPYGKTGWHTLSSVAYTHQRVSYGAEPRFNCQNQNPNCHPSSTDDCSVCAAQPTSNYPKMVAQLRRYLRPDIGLRHTHSRFTIKAKLQANHMDDGRPTAVKIHRYAPTYIMVFAGKVNSVYALESALESGLAKTPL